MNNGIGADGGGDDAEGYWGNKGVGKRLDAPRKGISG